MPVIGNDAISLSNEFSGKNGSKLVQRYSTHAHADVKKNKQLKMFFMTNMRSLKYAPKEFSKVNACAQDPPWCYKNTQFSRQHRSITHANPEWYVLTVFSAAPCSFDLQTTVSSYNFKLDKDLIHAGPRIGIYDRDLIHKSLYTLLHFSSQTKKKISIFCSTIVNIVFSFINISTLHLLYLQPTL